MDLINDLTSAKIINDNEATRILNFIQKEALPPPLGYFEALYCFFLDRNSEEINKNIGFVIAGMLTPLSPSQQNSKEVIALLEILLKYKLVNDNTYHRLAEIAKHCLTDEFNLLYLANELANLQTTFTIENQLAFAEILNQKYAEGLITGIVSNGELLQKAIKENKLLSYLDFFKYSELCTILDLSQYLDHHEKLLTDLTEILNKLTYHTPFKIQDINYSISDFSGIPIHHTVKCTVYINTGEQIHQYDHTDFFMLKSQKHRGPVENILKSVNSLLADFNFNYRFTSITSKLSDVLFPEYNNKLIICRVDRDNQHIFNSYNLDGKLIYTNPAFHFQIPVSYKHITYVIHHFKESGIFSNLNEAELKERIESIYQKTYYGPSDILALFPEIVIPVVTDPPPGIKPYKQLLESLNRISNGILNFSNIEDCFPNYDPETYFNEREFKVSFEMDAEQYMFVSNYLEIGFNNPVIHGITEIISQKHPDYQLIRLSTSRIYYDLYLFAPKDTIYYLSSRNLL